MGLTTFEIGKLGESIALDFERSRFGVETGEFVRDVSANTTLGYDIESLETAFVFDRPRFIEVKVIGRKKSFVISKKEIEVLLALGSTAYIYLVDIGEKKVSHILDGAKIRTLLLEPRPLSFRIFF